MRYEVRKVDYQRVLIEDPCTLAALSALDLLAVSGFQDRSGKTQLEWTVRCGQELSQAARELGLRLSEKKSGFLIAAERGPEALADALSKFRDAGIDVTLQAVSTGAGYFGALLCVDPSDVRRAAATLFDPVDESSEESFPASDAPSWAMSGRA